MQQNKRLTLCLLLAGVFGFTQCTRHNDKADAYGNFESVETYVSSEMSGKLLALTLEEGQKLEAHTAVGLIDTSLLSLQVEELVAQTKKLNANLRSIEAQARILEQQKKNLQTDLKRIENMLASGAATQKQYDDIQGAIDVVDTQLAANKAQQEAAAGDRAVLASKRALIREQMNKCHITNPKTGTVLEKYAEEGEITAAGKPLYKLADLDKIDLRAYVSGAQLHSIQLGQRCRVFIDAGTEEKKEYEGTITWIASQSEFTPKIIQTHDERVNMVYALKIRVINDGSIKLGMPAEVLFATDRQEP